MLLMQRISLCTVNKSNYYQIFFSVLISVQSTGLHHKITFIHPNKVAMLRAHVMDILGVLRQKGAGGPVKGTLFRP